MTEAAFIMKKKRKEKKLIGFNLSIPKNTLDSLKANKKEIIDKKDFSSSFYKTSKKKKKISHISKTEDNLNEQKVIEEVKMQVDVIDFLNI